MSVPYGQADSKIKCYFCTLKSPGVNLFNSNFNVGHASQLVTDQVGTRNRIFEHSESAEKWV